MTYSTRPQVLWCPNVRGSASNGWSFPKPVEKLLLRMTEGQTVLHLFGGRSRFGTRLDIDGITQPHVFGDAWLPPFAKNSFDTVIIDPPYFPMSSAQKDALFRAAGYIAKTKVIWFSTVWMSAGSGLRLKESWLVRVGESCAIRCIQVFEVISKPGPVKHFKRGPAMKYNKWLANPQSLNLQEVGAPDQTARHPAGT